MDSTLSPTQGDPHQGSDEVVVQMPKDQLAVIEQALSELVATGPASERRTHMAESETFAGLKIAEPSLDATLPAADLKNRGGLTERPSLSRRVARAVGRFLIAVFIGIGATLAWQSCGDTAKQMI